MLVQIGCCLGQVKYWVEFGSQCCCERDQDQGSMSMVFVGLGYKENAVFVLDRPTWVIRGMEVEKQIRLVAGARNRLELLIPG